MDGDDSSKCAIARIINMLEQSIQILNTINSVRPSDPERALRTYLWGIKKIQFALHLVERFPELQVCSIFYVKFVIYLSHKRFFFSRTSCCYFC
jgi:hypothetical protein